MAVGTASGFVIHEDEYYMGMTEVLQQNTDVFNGASRDGIRLVAGQSEGHFQKEAFFKEIASLVTRRDITSTAAVADGALGSAEVVSPKVNRKVGPIANTLDSLKKIASDEREFSLLLGQQVGKAKLVDYVETLLKSGVAALSGVTTGGPSGSGLHYKNIAAGEVLTLQKLNSAFSYFGDARERIVCLVMHSLKYADIVSQQLDIACDSVAGATIYNGTVGTLNRPVIVTDSPSLIKPDGVALGTDSYYTLALTPDALVAQDSEQDTMVSDLVTGAENLFIRIQGEHAYNVKLKGFSYAGATANPTDAALATTANWAKAFTDVKALAGVLIETP